MDLQKYSFWRALRPFSFSVALVVCLTGVIAAFPVSTFDSFSAVLVLFGGLLLQAGVNLINDFADRSQVGSAHALCRIYRNFRVGLGCFLIATIIALYLVAQVGQGLLWLALVGIIWALGYTLEPVNYKRRGLGVPLVFWLMGVLMVVGSYFAVTGQFSLAVVYQSVPVSLLTALLLLSNELRDYESDREAGIQTLTVRVGYASSVWLYRGLLIGAYCTAVILWMLGLVDALWLLLPSLLVLSGPLKLLRVPAEQRVALTPLTGRLFLVFGLGYCGALMV